MQTPYGDSMSPYCIPSASFILNDKLVVVEDMKEKKGRKIRREEAWRKTGTLH